MQAGSDDGMPRCTVADAMAQGGKCTHGHPRDEGVVTGGWCSGGNCGGIVSERATVEDLEEDDPDRWAPSVSDSGSVMGWQAGSRAEMGRGQCRAGLVAEKTTHTYFFPF
jgi:hypothetical protein